jgi:hypothetical protein
MVHRQTTTYSGGSLFDFDRFPGFIWSAVTLAHLNRAAPIFKSEQ